MFLGKVVAFLRNISFFCLFKSSFIDVEPPFNVYEPPFNDAERTFNVDERRFLLLVSTKKLRYKSNSYCLEMLLYLSVWAF